MMQGRLDDITPKPTPIGIDPGMDDHADYGYPEINGDHHLNRCAQYRQGQIDHEDRCESRRVLAQRRNDTKILSGMMIPVQRPEALGVVHPVGPIVKKRIDDKEYQNLTGITGA